MPLPDNLNSYAEVREALDKALDSEKGVRIRCDNHGAAVHLRHKIYKFRTLDRRESMKLFSADDARYGNSAYDGLVALIADDNTSVIIKRGAALIVEELE